MDGVIKTQKGTGAKVKIKVPEILEAEDADAALVALKYAREYAEKGDVIGLMDLLTPESARSYRTTDKKGNPRRLRS